MNYIKKLLLIIGGSIIAGAGTAISINAGFGCATLAVLWQGISIHLPLSIGQSSMLVSLLMLVCVLCYDKSQIHIGTVIHMLIYSISLDLFGMLDLLTNFKILNLGVMLFGIVLFGVGVGIYASAEFGKGPYESITFAISKKRGWHIKYVRICLDAIFIVIGFALGGAVGICTLATMALSGFIIEKTYAVLSFRDIKTPKHC